MTRKSNVPRVLNMFYGYPAELVAQWCCVSIQTAVKYKRNILKPSKQSVALFRLHADKCIVPDDWHGWVFHDGKLFDPQGAPFTRMQLEAYQYIFQLASSRAPDEVAKVLRDLMIA
jgi:Phage protein